MKLVYPTGAPKIFKTFSDGPFVRKAFRQYEELPYVIRSTVEKMAVRIYVAHNRVVPDFPGFEDLAEEQPRGWAEGDTWQMVEGCYCPVGGIVVSGVGETDRMHVFLHELGHAYSDHQQFQYVSNEDEFIEAYVDDIDNLCGYESIVDESYAMRFAQYWGTKHSRGFLSNKTPFIYKYFESRWGIR